MRRKITGFVVIAALLSSGATAFAASHPSSANASASASTSASANGSASSHNAAAFGIHVAEAIADAQASGSSGTVVAQAIHQVLLNEHSNAKGLSVAMAVYANDQSSGSPTTTFLDVKTEAPWATAAVSALEKAGVVQGTSTTTFSPNADVTVAELATMLARLQAESPSNTSSAPSGTPAWALKAMAWAETSGVMTNVQNLGQPDAPLTRAQAVLMLINAAGLSQSAAMDANASINLEGNVPAWAHGAIALAIQMGLLQGSDGQVLANSTLTRAQMAVLLARLAVLEAASSTSSSSSAS